ncbi:MAG: hypothetical protein ACYTFV_03040 [Planctomycetota bacterium]|jgi:hypothetical protein
MKLETALAKAEAWAQAEQGAQLVLKQRLEAHERALGGGSPEEIAESLAGVDEALAGERERSRQRRIWTSALAEIWGVEARTLTLGSVVMRAGDLGERLARRRTELEEAVRQTADAGRRVAMIARAQRSVVREVLRTLTGADPESPERASGTLVNAHA